MTAASRPERETAMTSNLKKLALPTLALLLTLAVLLQVKGMGGKGGGLSLAGVGAAEPHTKVAAGAAAVPPGGESVSAEGRLVTYPGGEVVVGTDLAGTVVRMLVQEKQRVRRGQP